MKILPTSFEDFLKDEFLSEYSGVKDTFEEDFDAWLAGLDGNEYIQYGEKLYKNVFDILKKIETKFRREDYMLHEDDFLKILSEQ